MTSIAQAVFVLIGLALAFFGLSIYKGFIKAVGFIVGAGYAIYLATLFAGGLNWEPLLIFAAGVILVVLLGVLGSYVAQFANVLMFFLAGGLVGVIVGKIIMGSPPEEAMELLSVTALGNLIKPAPGDLLWFLGGGFIFVISIDVLVILAFSTLGAGLIWFAIRPMHLMDPDWIIPLVIGILGLTVQEGSRRRVKSPPRLPPRTGPREVTR